MGKRQMLWKTKGMNRDLSVSAFNPEFAFENMNLRLSTNEGNTLLSWVSEKGTKQITSSGFNMEVPGIPIGTAIVGNQLVLFTTSNSAEEADHTATDCIYVLKYEDDEKTKMVGTEPFYAGNLNFSSLHPLETLVSVESEVIKKVYWVDGRNQPRLVNIAGNKRYEHIVDAVDTWFDFVPDINISNAEIRQNVGSSGTFEPGVIQYCFTYFNKYGQQTNIVWVSPLYYLGHSDRGAKPDDKVSSSFSITINEPDGRFDYIRLYSIHRTSLDAVPIVKVLDDIAIKNSNNTVETINYTDSGTTGAIIDPMELQYVGGREIVAKTFVDKDDTLFVGNFEEKNLLLKKKKIEGIEVKSEYKRTNLLPDAATGTYSYKYQLTDGQSKITTFKGGEWYRLGFQLQKVTGEWSEPVWIGDYENPKYPDENGKPVQFSAVIGRGEGQIDVSKVVPDDSISSFVNIRPVIVYPTIADRTVLCQGVLNPTVFNVMDRPDNSPYAQASWYFRPIYKGEEQGGHSGHDASQRGSLLPFGHFESLVTDREFYSMVPSEEQGGTVAIYHYQDVEPIATIPAMSRIEIQGSVKKYGGWEDRRDGTNGGKDPVEGVESNTQFFVDQSIQTFNSPDIEFDTEVQSCDFNSLKLRIVGYIPVVAGAADFAITTSSAMLELGYHSDTKTERGDFWHTDAGDYNNWYKNTNPSFGSGEKSRRVSYNVEWNTPSSTGGFWHLVSGCLWNDSYIIATGNRGETDTDHISSDWYSHDFMVYPWQRSGSLNNDYRSADVASSLLKTKKESNLLFSDRSEYSDTNIGLTVKGCQLHLTENEYIENLRVDGKNYYPNIDKVLYNTSGYIVHSKTYIEGDGGILYNTYHMTPKRTIMATSPISMKYKSTSHAVIALNSALPNKKTDEAVIGVSAKNFLWLGELYRDNIPNRFGGNSDSALRSNKWMIAGETMPISGESGRSLVWDIGDTYYQRYDCLKTYAFTPEDPNQIVEILSFMCETHVNIDGRYDRNRGMIDNTDMHPRNFNLLNTVYSQKNNFFTYRQMDTEEMKGAVYPNQIWYSKTKTSGADADLWTNVTLASTLALDGDKGELNALRRFNNQIIAFQDSGLSQVLYNENTVLSTQEGVPVEIANSNKVSGKQYISSTVGCSNKWSIVNTPSGLYFMDSNEKSIYLYNGQLGNLSVEKGFNSWCKQEIPGKGIEWEPLHFDSGYDIATNSTGEYRKSAFRGMYDRQNQDVLWVNKKKALAYSEKVGAFTSFYDYGGSPFFVNLEDTGVWLRGGWTEANASDTGAYKTTLWKHGAGEYCQFFGENKPYWTILVGNPEPQLDKIFTNLEFRASVDGDMSVSQEHKDPWSTFDRTFDYTFWFPGEEGTESKGFYLPFDYLETWNEYQHGKANLSVKNGHGPSKHHLKDEDTTAHLARKFRIWRCDIPRDNWSLEDQENEKKMGIFRHYRKPNDRMRNPWLYLKLMKQAEENSQKALPKTEVHDVVMTYFG